MTGAAASWRPRGAKWADVPPGGIAAGVADMDLPPPPAAPAAARAALEAGATGYAATADLHAAVDVADGWWRERHGLALPVGHTAVTRSAVAAVAGVLARATRPGDAVVRCTPGYPPLAWAVAAAGLVDRTVPLTPDAGGRWGVDLDRLVAALEGAAVLLWVQPANPTGTVWTAHEQAVVAAAAAAHDVLVVSDEVWGDLVHDPHRHVPFAPVAAEQAPGSRVVTVVGATKTFNLAGLAATFVTWGDDALAALVAGPGEVPLLTVPGLPTLDATVAAYTTGAGWLERTRAVLRRNRDVATQRLRAALGDDAVAEQAATYLLWVRAPAGWGAAPATHLRERAGVVVGDGSAYGLPGFVRCNLALSPDACDELVDRLVAAAG